jgi:hypothetical protein
MLGVLEGVALAVALGVFEGVALMLGVFDGVALMLGVREGVDVRLTWVGDAVSDAGVGDAEGSANAHGVAA